MSQSQLTRVVQAGAEEATVILPRGSSPASVLSSTHPRYHILSCIDLQLECRARLLVPLTHGHQSCMSVQSVNRCHPDC